MKNTARLRKGPWPLRAVMTGIFSSHLIQQTTLLLEVLYVNRDRHVCWDVLCLGFVGSSLRRGSYIIMGYYYTKLEIE